MANAEVRQAMPDWAETPPVHLRSEGLRSKPTKGTEWGSPAESPFLLVSLTGTGAHQAREVYKTYWPACKLGL